MPAVNKIDSNQTGLAYALEAEIGYLPGENGNAGSPVWYRLDPNSYDDFGGEITTVAPNTINSSRQRRKGQVTDLESAGGFNHNLTFSNLTDLMQGVMFAAIREKGVENPTAIDVSADPDIFEVDSTTGFLVGSLIHSSGFANSTNNGLFAVTAVVSDTSIGVADGTLVVDASPATGSKITVVGVSATTGDVDVTSAGDFATLTSTTLDFTTLGLVPGQWIFVGGDSAGTRFTTPANNGFKRIRSVTENAIVIDKSESAMVTEANTTSAMRIFFGDVLRNEDGTSIVRRSYQLERTLGVPDTDNPSDVQSEFIRGAIPNEVTINIPSAELMNVDMSFLAIDFLQRDADTGPKQTSVQVFDSTAEFNTSSDVVRLNLASVSPTNEAPTPLFAYATEVTLSINNNMSPNKAVGVLGAFDMSAGNFEVMAEMEVYFTTVSSTQAIRNNANITLDMAFVKDNAGMIIDLPLLSLGNGRLNVEINEPIKVPITSDAASGEDILSTFNHTMLITYFNYLPDAAE